MATLPKNSVTGHNEHWKLTVDASHASTPIELQTAGKYVDRNIDIYVPQAAETVSGTGNVTVSSVSAGTKANGKYPITATVSVSGTATASVGTQGFTDSTSYTGSVTKGSVTNNATLTAAAATVSGSATVKPNGLTAANGNAQIASAATTTQPSSGYYVAATPSTAASTTITQSKSGLTAGYLGTLDEISASGSVSGGAGSKYYIPIKSAGVTKGTTTVNASTKAVTRGTFDVSEGYISGTAGDLAAATFANTATSGTTYVDISETTAAPILASGDYLYINQGYTDNLKISLAKLVPELPEGYTMGTSADLLSGKTLYDNDGNRVTGTILTKGSKDLSASGATVTVPAGYYPSQVTKSVASGSVNSYAIDETTQASKVLTAGTLASGYYPISVPSLTGTVNRTAGYISGTTSTAADSDGGVVGKIAASTTSKTDGTATASANTTHNLVSGTYATTATTGYTYHVDATASASTTAASISAGVGYVGTAVSASTAAASSGNKSSNVYLLDGVITNNTSGGTSVATITSGKQIKIAKGYYPEDKYYTAQSFTQQAITNNLTTGADSGVTAPTLIETSAKATGKTYVSFSAQGSMTQGNQYNGTSTAKTQWMEVYDGTYTVS